MPNRINHAFLYKKKWIQVQKINSEAINNKYYEIKNKNFIKVVFSILGDIFVIFSFKKWGIIGAKLCHTTVSIHSKLLKPIHFLKCQHIQCKCMQKCKLKSSTLFFSWQQNLSSPTFGEVSILTWVGVTALPWFFCKISKLNSPFWISVLFLINAQINL